MPLTRWFLASPKAAGALLTAWMCMLAWSSASATPTVIRVTTDDAFPPYTFRDVEGRPAGYLLELWQLWETKTGVKVQFIATHWGEARRLIDADRDDAIMLLDRHGCAFAGRAAGYERARSFRNLPVDQGAKRLLIHPSVAKRGHQSRN